MKKQKQKEIQKIKESFYSNEKASHVIASLNHEECLALCEELQEKDDARKETFSLSPEEECKYRLAKCSSEIRELDINFFKNHPTALYLARPLYPVEDKDVLVFPYKIKIRRITETKFLRIKEATNL